MNANSIDALPSTPRALDRLEVAASVTATTKLLADNLRAGGDDLQNEKRLAGAPAPFHQLEIASTRSPPNGQRPSPATSVDTVPPT
jgi:hypothetical protein